MLHQIEVARVAVHPVAARAREDESLAAVVRVRKSAAMRVPRELRENPAENGRNRDHDHLEEALLQNEPCALEAGQEMHGNRNLNAGNRPGQRFGYDFVE